VSAANSVFATAPHAARAEVISLTIFDGSLSEFQPNDKA